MSDVQAVRASLVPVIEPEAAEYVKKHGLEESFRHALQKTPEMFPTARAIRVFMERDPELSDYWFLVFEIRVPDADVADRLEAKRRWARESLNGCAPPIKQLFSIDLILVQE